MKELEFIESLLRNQIRLVTRSGRPLSGRYSLFVQDRRLYLDGKERIPLKEAVAIYSSQYRLVEPEQPVSSWNDNPIVAMYLTGLINRKEDTYILSSNFMWIRGVLLLEFPYTFVIQIGNAIAVVFKHGTLLLTPEVQVMHRLSSLERNLPYLPWIPPWKKISVKPLIKPVFSHRPVKVLIRGIKIPVTLQVESFSAHYILGTLLKDSPFGYQQVGTVLFMRASLEHVLTKTPKGAEV